MFCACIKKSMVKISVISDENVGTQWTTYRKNQNQHLVYMMFIKLKHSDISKLPLKLELVKESQIFNRHMIITHLKCTKRRAVSEMHLSLNVCGKW